MYTRFSSALHSRSEPVFLSFLIIVWKYTKDISFLKPGMDDNEELPNFSLQFDFLSSAKALNNNLVQPNEQ